MSARFKAVDLDECDVSDCDYLPVTPTDPDEDEPTEGVEWVAGELRHRYRDAHAIEEYDSW